MIGIDGMISRKHARLAETAPFLIQLTQRVDAHGSRKSRPAARTIGIPRTLHSVGVDRDAAAKHQTRDHTQ